jgi:hypothetical protein
MTHPKFISVEEIDSTYSNHLKSLEVSGQEFDKPKLLQEWAKALKEFDESL